MPVEDKPTRSRRMERRDERMKMARKLTEIKRVRVSPATEQLRKSIRHPRFGGFRFVIIGDNGYLILLAIDLQPAGSVDLLCAHFRAARELDPPLRCRAGHRPEHPDLEGLRRRAGD